MRKIMTATYGGDSGHYHLFDMDGGQELMGTIFVPKGEPIPKFVTVLIHLRAKAKTKQKPS